MIASPGVPGSDRGAPASPRTMAWVGLAIMVGLAFFSFLDRHIITLMVTPLKQELGVSDTEIGILEGPAFGLVYPIFGLALGYTVDRFSRRLVIFWAVLFWACAAMGSGLANSFLTLLVARVGVGVGEAAVLLATSSLLSELFPKHRLATVFSIYASGSILGQAGALSLGGAVLHWAAPGMETPIGYLEAWQIAFIVTGAPAALLAPLIMIVPEPRHDPGYAAVESEVAPWPEVFQFVRRTWAYLACYAIGYTLLILVGTGVWSWQPAVMERSFGWTPVVIGSALGLFTVAFGWTGQLLNGLVVDRMFARSKDAHFRYYAIGALIIVASGCIAPLASGPVLYLLLLGPMKYLMNFGGVFNAALQVVTPPRMRGRLMGMVYAITGIFGFSLGPWVLALFTDHVFDDPSKTIWSTALLTAIFVPVAGVLFALGMKPMREAVARAG